MIQRGRKLVFDQSGAGRKSEVKLTGVIRLYKKRMRSAGGRSFRPSTKTNNLDQSRRQTRATRVIKKLSRSRSHLTQADPAQPCHMGSSRCQTHFCHGFFTANSPFRIYKLSKGRLPGFENYPYDTVQRNPFGSSVTDSGRTEIIDGELHHGSESNQWCFRSSHCVLLVPLMMIPSMQLLLPTQVLLAELKSSETYTKTNWREKYYRKVPQLSE